MEGLQHTALGRTEVFARGRSAGFGAASLLDAESPAFDVLALQAILRCVRLLSGHHANKAEAARLSCPWVAHDVALLDFSIL